MADADVEAEGADARLPPGIFNIRYGSFYRIRSLYSQGTYLDSFGRATISGATYNVVTSIAPSAKNDGSDVWKIESAKTDGKPADGSAVAFGEEIYLVNQYETRKNKQTYLDTNGGMKNGNALDVTTCDRNDRGNGTAKWRIFALSEIDGKDIKTDNVDGRITANTNDIVTFENQYQVTHKEGNKKQVTYLDTCGVDSASKTEGSGVKYSVSTSWDPNRAANSGAWALELAPYVDWEIECENIEFDQSDIERLQDPSASKKPEVISAFDFNNSSRNSTFRQTFQRTYSRQFYFEFSLSQSLAVGASVTAGVDVKAFNLSKSFTINITLTAGQKWSDTTTEVTTVTQEITVGPQDHVMAISQLDWVHDAKVRAQMRLMVRAKDMKTGNFLAGPTLLKALNDHGFSGQIVTEPNQGGLDETQVRVTITGLLRGSWGLQGRMMMSNSEVSEGTT